MKSLLGKFFKNGPLLLLYPHSPVGHVPRLCGQGSDIHFSVRRPNHLTAPSRPQTDLLTTWYDGRAEIIPFRCLPVRERERERERQREREREREREAEREREREREAEREREKERESFIKNFPGRGGLGRRHPGAFKTNTRHTHTHTHGTLGRRRDDEREISQGDRV
jgi:hypothetical protein